MNKTFFFFSMNRKKCVFPQKCSFFSYKMSFHLKYHVNQVGRKKIKFCSFITNSNTGPAASRCWLEANPWTRVDPGVSQRIRKPTSPLWSAFRKASNSGVSRITTARCSARDTGKVANRVASYLKHCVLL